jgi:GNAT superfamily N-acetyltransferase
LAIGFALIANIAVDPQLQGRKIGSALLQLAETEARDRNCSELRLATHSRLTENIAMYEHLGWTEFDRSSEKERMKKEIPL